MPRYWWQCMSCGDTPAWLTVCRSRSICAHHFRRFDMCPLTIAGVATAASAAVGAVGGIKSDQAQKKLANSQATMQEQDAARTQQIAQQQERDFRLNTADVMSARRAGLGAQGVTAEGTPALVDESVVAKSELQALRIRTGGVTDATRMQQQAALTRMGGANAETAGYYRAGASLLSGAAGAWGKRARPHRSSVKNKKGTRAAGARPARLCRGATCGPSSWKARNCGSRSGLTGPPSEPAR